MALQLACQQFTTAERIDSFCGCSVDSLATFDVDLEDIIDAASDAVVIATGGQITGRCSTTVRPCADASCVCGRWADGCNCCRLDTIRLKGDLIEIVQVKIDGAIIPENTYGFLDGNGLVRVGNESATWPGCQHLNRPDSAAGTFSITYEYGSLPFVAVMAATEIACDLMLGVTSKTSRLDPAVVTAIMDGVTVEFDPATLGLFDWTRRLVGQYPAGPQPFVWSPEIDDGWQLHTTSY